MSATASVPGAVYKENHFLLVNTRRTNWQSSRPGGYRDVINNGNKGYSRGSTPRCLHKQGIIAAQITLYHKEGQTDQWKGKAMIHKYHMYNLPKGKQSMIYMTTLYLQGVKGGYR